MTEQARKQLGRFLRTQRESLSPEEFDFPVGRRRTPGLRREEVAQLAGISPTWYTWIEQGRDIGFSQEVLESLARVFKLSEHETRYMLTLIGQSRAGPARREQGTISTETQIILDHQGSYPAYIINRYWDILGWNQAARKLFIGIEQLGPYSNNLIWYMFISDQARQLVTDWEARARRMLAEFRSDSSHLLEAEQLQQFLADLNAASPAFTRWWSDHDVLPREGGRREFSHPQVGHLVLHQTTLVLGDQPNKKLVLHQPVHESDTAAKLERLVASNQSKDAL